MVISPDLGDPRDIFKCFLATQIKDSVDHTLAINPPELASSFERCKTGVWGIRIGHRSVGFGGLEGPNELW